MEEKYLPIGSVVKLKDGEKRLMITGYLPIEDDSKEKKYGIIVDAYIQREC